MRYLSYQCLKLLNVLAILFFAVMVVYIVDFSSHVLESMDWLILKAFLSLLTLIWIGAIFKKIFKSYSQTVIIWNWIEPIVKDRLSTTELLSSLFKWFLIDLLTFVGLKECWSLPPSKKMPPFFPKPPWQVIP